MAYPWTDEEVALLKAKINTNIKAADIAAQMNIPVREVYEKSSQLRKAGELDRVREYKVAELQECVDEIKIGNILTENQQETLVIMITKILQDMGEARPTLMGPSNIFAMIFRGNGVATERIIALVEILKMLTDETYYNRGESRNDEETEKES